MMGGEMLKARRSTQNYHESVIYEIHHNVNTESRQQDEVNREISI